MIFKFFFILLKKLIIKKRTNIDLEENNQKLWHNLHFFLILRNRMFTKLKKKLLNEFL